VHPIATEAVDNVVGRADLLAAMAVLAGLLIYGSATAKSGQRRWLALFAVAAAGAFSKENAVMLAALMLLSDSAFGVPGGISTRQRLAAYGAALGSAVTLLAARFLVFAPLAGVHLTLGSFLLIALTVFLVAFALTALGIAIAWPMDSSAAFHAIINLFLIPLWLLSGALFPLSGASGWIRWLMYANPLTYGVEALRTLMYPAAAASFSLTVSLLTLVIFTLIMFGLAFVVVSRRTTKPAA